MTEKEFKDVFIPLSTVWTKSNKVSETMSAPYFGTVQRFPIAVFKRAADEIIDVSPPDFPKPSAVLSICLTMQKLIMEESKPTAKPQTLIDATQTPKALEARRKFWQTVKDVYDVPKERTLFAKTGFKSINFALAEATILHPYREQMAYLKKQKGIRKIKT